VGKGKKIGHEHGINPSGNKGFMELVRNFMLALLSLCCPLAETVI
jgi:hypothetical protein